MTLWMTNLVRERLIKNESQLVTLLKSKTIHSIFWIMSLVSTTPTHSSSMDSLRAVRPIRIRAQRRSRNPIHSHGSRTYFIIQRVLMKMWSRTLEHLPFQRHTAPQEYLCPLHSPILPITDRRPSPPWHRSLFPQRTPPIWHSCTLAIMRIHWCLRPRRTLRLERSLLWTLTTVSITLQTAILISIILRIIMDLEVIELLLCRTSTPMTVPPLQIYQRILPILLLQISLVSPRTSLQHAWSIPLRPITFPRWLTSPQSPKEITAAWQRRGMDLEWILQRRQRLYAMKRSTWASTLKRPRERTRRILFISARRKWLRRRYSPRYSTMSLCCRCIIQTRGHWRSPLRTVMVLITM